MSHQTGLKAWVAGFFDGDGSVIAQVRESDTTDIGHRVSPQAIVNQHYLAGLFDAEGYVNAKVAQSDTTSTEYRIQPAAEIEMAEHNPVMKRLQEYADEVGFKASIQVRDGREGNQSPKFRWEVRSIDNVELFFRSIMDNTVVKKEQIRIMVDEIIPIIRRGDHTTRRGFLECIYWKEKMDSMKGGNRGKYNLQYFEEMWGMEL